MLIAAMLGCIQPVQAAPAETYRRLPVNMNTGQIPLGYVHDDLMDD